jgi:hypothetical protein
VFTTGFEHPVPNVLEEKRIRVVSNVVQLFFSMLRCSLAVVCLVGRLVGRLPETEALRLFHVVRWSALRGICRSTVASEVGERDRGLRYCDG